MCVFADIYIYMKKEINNGEATNAYTRRHKTHPQIRIRMRTRAWNATTVHLMESHSAMATWQENMRKLMKITIEWDNILYYLNAEMCVCLHCLPARKSSHSR